MTQEKSRGPQLDTAILELNQAINDCISAYTDAEIIFDLPEFEQKPDRPTVSVFLFDIHEDLELRNGRMRHFAQQGVPGQPQQGLANKPRAFQSQTVNVTCRYLMTYWGTVSEDSTNRIATSPTSQSLRTINAVLNGLLNMRRFSSSPKLISRVIPPMDLQNLGTFWQALGNRPRLCLGYDCTIPVQLHETEAAWPVHPGPNVSVLPRPEAIAAAEAAEGKPLGIEPGI
ncbi:MAG: DUF4255 domain-containing protein [Actinobacteria bacterium]|nr:DUF4255 domain-containing protein [Actinomycetota bacterium]